MRGKTLTAAVGIVCTAVALSACSSSKNTTPASSTGASAASKGSGTVKIGVLSDLSGAASSAFATTEKGIKAYVEGLNAAGGVNGQKVEYVMADTASSPTGALTAAEKLVQSDKVFAIVEVSAEFFGAQPYLLKQGVPVIGGAFDSLLWTDPKQTNLFAAPGVQDYSKAPLSTGNFFKSKGVTKCGSIGYASTESSRKDSAGAIKSCEAVGLQNAYLNNQVPFGSTDMGAIALKIKAAGVDGIYYSTVPNTAFALNAALLQIGVKLKAALLITGYGGDLLESSAAVTAAQNDDFRTVGLPAEANTAATNKRATDLAAVGVTGPPTFAEQQAYLAMSAFVAGLKAAGPSPSRAVYMTKLRAVTDFNGDGLLGPGTVNFSDYSPMTVCNNYVELKGNSFNVEPGSPFCAGVVPAN